MTSFFITMISVYRKKENNQSDRLIVYIIFFFAFEKTPLLQKMSGLSLLTGVRLACNQGNAHYDLCMSRLPIVYGRCTANL